MIPYSNNKILFNRRDEIYKDHQLLLSNIELHLITRVVQKEKKNSNSPNSHDGPTLIKFLF
jgi:hypothetical protein